MENEFIVVQHSRWPVKQTIDTLQETLLKKGATIYARIDQQAEVLKAGLVIKAIEFLLFGNPAVGGELMAINPVIALDLPLKIIAWENEQGDTLVAYNDPRWLAQRYHLDEQLVAKLDLKGLVAGLQ